MNNLKTTGLILLFVLSVARLAAQQQAPINEPDLNKPALFADFPDKIQVDVSELKSLFGNEAARGTDLAVKFMDKKLPGFNGKLVSLSSKYNNTLRSVVISSTKFNGATLTLSSSTTTDGAAVYTGRIISFQHADLFVLERENGAYYFIKKKYHDLINE